MKRGKAKRSQNVGGVLQEEMFAPESDWTPTPLNDLPQSWQGVKRVGFDVETREHDIKKLGPGVRHPDCYIVGYSFCLDGEVSAYVPFRHLGGGNLDVDQSLGYLADRFKEFDGEVITANGGYDMDYSLQAGVTFPKVKRWRDVLVTDNVINERHRRYNLQSVSERHGFEGKETKLLDEAAEAYGIKRYEMWKLHSKYVGPYGDGDAVLPVKVYEKQEKLISDGDLTVVNDLESDLLPVLVMLRRQGLLVDWDRLEQIERWSTEREAEQLARVKKMTGYDIGVGNVWKPGRVAKALENLGVVFTGKPELSQAVLADLGPCGEAIIRARKFNKLRTTFAQSLRNHAVNGRIHPGYNQTRVEKEDGTEAGARFGRLSGDHPNIQQQPARDEFAKMWRSVYLPEPGCEWAACDFSQQEPKWTIHYAELMGLAGAAEAAQAYRDNPATDNHKLMTTIIHGAAVVDNPKYESLRTAAKQIFLGLCYGKGGAAFCRDLGLPTRWAWYVRGEGVYTRETQAEAVAAAKGARLWEAAGEEGQAMLDKFNEGVPFVTKFAKKAEEVAKARGYVRTTLGRRCHFVMDKFGNYMESHKALNRIIQGSAADQVKMAMVKLHAAGLPMQIQVHDEIGASVADRAQAEAIAEVMRDAVACNVPAKVDIEMGPTWGHSMLKDNERFDGLELVRT